MKNPAKKTVPVTTKLPPVAKEPEPMPGIGAILLYRASEDVSWPMIVTSVGETTVSGQSFMAGTERGHVENVTLGDGVGQCSAPPTSNTHPKEA